MAKQMSEDELDAALPTATSVDSHDFRSDEDENDYVIAELYRCPDGRFFRYVEASGMSSRFDGSGHLGTWLAAGEKERWMDV